MYRKSDMNRGHAARKILARPPDAEAKLHGSRAIMRRERKRTFNYVGDNNAQPSGLRFFYFTSDVLFMQKCLMLFSLAKIVFLRFAHRVDGRTKTFGTSFCR